MRQRLLLALLLLTLPVIPCFADTPDLKLDTALAGAERLDHQFIFCVEADRVSLPKKPDSDSGPIGQGDPVLPGASVDQAGIAYNRSERNFGTLRAVAPPTMVVLSTNPGDPNIYDGMPAGDSFVLLADSLTDSQWQAMTSAGGLGVGDLTDARQRDLFVAMLPYGKLKIAPWYANSLLYTEKDTRDLTSSIEETRIRILRKPMAMIMYDGKSGSQESEIPDADNTDRWKLVSPENWGGSKDTVFGVKVREELPNVPKVAEIDYNSAALNVPVDVTGLHTVADLVKAVALSTHIELYADARLEPAKLTILPPKQAAGAITTAGDLLQALAFCVTGTWRQVGPAFILTDDIAGIGTRAQQLFEFERHGDALRKDPLYDAGEDMLKRHSPNDIGWLGAPEAWTAKQMNGQYYAGKQASFIPSIDGPMGDLTPAQQSLVLRADKQFASDYSWQYKQEGNSPPGPKTRVELMAQIDVQLIVPTVIKPVETGVVVADSQLFQTRPDPHQYDNRGGAPQTYAQMADYLKQHPDILEQLRKRNPALVDRILNPPPVKPVDVRQSLATIAHRAVIVSAKSVAEAQAIVDQVKASGFNELWLMVFDKGKADVGASTLSKATALSGGKDVLDAAIEEGRKQGVDVYAGLNLLAWGSDPPKGTSDFTITGETSAQVWARENVYLANHDSNLEYEAGMIALDRPIDATSVYVNPFTPKVAEPLDDLIRNVAHHTGIKGMSGGRYRRQDTVPFIPSIPPAHSRWVSTKNSGLRSSGQRMSIPSTSSAPITIRDWPMSACRTSNTRTRS